MKDISSISKNMIGKVKSSLGFKTEYAKLFKEADSKWYQEIYDSNPFIHEDLIKFLRSKKDIASILEIGCGMGHFPVENNELLKNIKYTGIDISQKNVDYCKKNSSYEFICGDFIKMKTKEKYDLVFSFAVVDHVYDINKFISNIVNITKKYVYINSYRGYFPDLEKHKMKWSDKDGIYYNNISVKQTKETLYKNGLSDDEFEIYSKNNGEFKDKEYFETIIKVSKNIS